MCQILILEWAAGLQDGARPSGCCFRLVIHVALTAARGAPRALKFDKINLF
jgi:hypothetical protein